MDIVFRLGIPGDCIDTVYELLGPRGVRGLLIALK